MGSGETSPTMVKAHRSLMAQPAVLLDTPFGFQENADDIVARAARQGLGLTTLGTYHVKPTPATRQAVIVGYGTPPDHAYPGALDLLCQVLGV
jgi:GntR family transcriptional regulator/MocR family aminotransferase